MEIRILGPLEVLESGQALDLGGAKQRAALTLLALNANRVVGREQLIDALWDGGAPETARKAVQVHVSQLRKLLGHERIETRPPGYVLRLAADELDLSRCERLAEAGRPDEALALWRGEPLADFAGRPFARAEIARLEELRLSCLEARIERDLAAGRHAALVGELDGLTREHPLREHLRAQLMLALYRAGRQAEALEAYQAARAALVGELGIEPGSRLRELQQRILVQDPALDLAVPQAVRAPEPALATAPVRTAATRKTVTVLFCDLAGSTGLAERLDPEPLRDLMARWFAAMREPVERHGGTVEKFIGDAVMAVFGVPYVHEDDALRAVRAAVEMRERLSRLNDELASERRPQLQIRIGVTTGEVFTSDDTTTLVTGDAVSTAKRLEEAAPSGEILIGSTTRALVANATELEPAEPIAAKGKHDPVEAWRVLATIAGAAPFARRLDAPLVGRTRELALLRDELAAAERDRSCRLATVYGPAGIGKSRLAAEFLAGAAASARVLTARCLPYGDGITFLPLAELVRSAGGEGAVAGAVAGEPDGALIAERVRGALGSDVAPASSEETFWAIRRLLEALARERPLVVCVEDVHWAQPMFLDLLEYAAAWSSDAPIVLLCLSRPDLLDERPRWGGAAFTLEPLTDGESQTLLDELASEWPMTPAARARIADGAEGNPLFLEQMVAMLSDRGTLPSDVPPTIQALLAARLDRLEPLERSVLERAAIVGKEFWRGAVLELSPDAERGDVSAVLLSLVRKELVRPQASPVAGEDGFRFRHALIRDAAHAAMPKSMRATLHEQFGTWLSTRAGEDEIVGYHLEQAARYRAELGVADAALAERAGELLGTAGARASARGDAAAALTLVRRSLALIPQQHGSRVELLRELSRALWLTGDADASELALSESIELARSRGDRRFEWYGRLEQVARNATTRGEADALVSTAQQAIEVFEELNDDLGLARAWRRLGLVAHTERRFSDAAEACERALAHAAESGDEQERAQVADLLCTALLFGPTRVDEAIDRVDAVLASASRNVVLRAHVSTSLAGLVAMRGDFAHARALYADAGAVYDELGLRLPRIGWTEVVAGVELLAGDPVEAIRILRHGYEILDIGGLEGLRLYHAAFLAFVLAGEGERGAAVLMTRACESCLGAPDPVATARLRGAQARIASSESERERLARDAIDAAECTDDLNLRAEMRLLLAQVLGEPAEAATARRLFEAKGNVAGAASTGLWSFQR
jgi:class 3 adenylate cyclase/tetratricopeptide (TPR) repeat protein